MCVSDPELRQCVGGGGGELEGRQAGAGLRVSGSQYSIRAMALVLC